MHPKPYSPISRSAASRLRLGALPGRGRHARRHHRRPARGALHAGPRPLSGIGDRLTSCGRDSAPTCTIAASSWASARKSSHSAPRPTRPPSRPGAGTDSASDRHLHSRGRSIGDDSQRPDGRDSLVPAEVILTPGGSMFRTTTSSRRRSPPCVGRPDERGREDR